MNTIQLQINQTRQQLFDLLQAIIDYQNQLAELQTQADAIQAQLSVLGNGPLEHLIRQQLIAQLGQIQTSINTTQADLDAAIAARQNAATTFQQLLADQQTQLDQALGEWPVTDLPVALLPVRLETCFEEQNGAWELLLRVYPDTIHADTHEPELTVSEENWGKNYWEQLWRIGTAQDQASKDQRKMAWTQLAQRFGENRAAWISKVLEPTNPQDQPANPAPEGQPLPQAIQFPATGQRADTWTRPPQTRVLPNRWLAMGYRADRCVLLHWGAQIPDQLQIGPDPQAGNGDNGSLLGPGMDWMIDFSEAENAGMAMRIPIATEDAQEGYDKLIVIGLKNELDGMAGATRLTELFDAHHYTGGLSFVQQGTPSNNTAEGTSGHKSRTSDFSRSFDNECGEPLIAPGGTADGNIMAEALGLESPVFSHINRADAGEQADSKDMQTALWPATWGYYLEQMIAPSISVAELRYWREHFIENVRARGPLPALRVGRQPYGWLPVTSLTDWAADTEESGFVSLLQNLRNKWREAANYVPRFDGGRQAAETMMDILGIEAVADHYTAIPVVHDSLFGTPEIPEIPEGEPGDFGNLPSPLETLGQFNLPSGARIASLLQFSADFALKTPLVQAAGGSVELSPDYISWLAAATYAELKNENLPAEITEPGAENSLLYLLLRHAAMLARKNAAFRVDLQQGLVDLTDRQDPVLVGILQNETLSDPVDVDLNDPEAVELKELLESLSRLQQLSVKELELLLRETLDLSAHRLDAWITSLAGKRLKDMRSQAGAGIYLGGYGWVENLRPAPTPTLAPNPIPGEGGQNLRVSDSNAGYVAAPSLNHATTAAILRSGYLAHRQSGGDEHPFAVDLSSERVRLSQLLLDGIRQGQSLSALLGYRFERGLHERQLDQYIESFRLLAPLGERYKAKAAVLAAQAVVDDLSDNEPPGLSELETLLQEAQSKKSTYSSKKSTLSTHLNQAQTAWNQLVSADQQLQIVWNVIFSSGVEQDPPPDLAQDLEEAQMAVVEAEQNYGAKTTAAGTTMNQFRTMHLSYFGAAYPVNKLNMVATNTSFSKVFDVSLANTKIQDLEEAIETYNDMIGDLEGWTDPGLPEATAFLQQKQEELEAIEQALRDQYLLPAGADVEALESIPAKNTVDGLALLRLWQAEEGNIPFGETIGDQTVALPTSGPDFEGLTAELDQLVNAVDAVSDALTAESVYQMAQGNPTGAGASLDTVARGEMPPQQLEVVQTPNNGISLTHRVFTLFSGLPPASSWPVNASQSRAGAEPYLNGWAAQLLGDPSKVLCKVEYLENETVAATGSMLLTDLELSPLDLVYMARAGGGAQQAELEQRLQYHAWVNRPAGVSENVAIRLYFSRQKGWPADQISFDEIMEQARSLRDLFSQCRPLQANHLALPGTVQTPGVDLRELQTRAEALKQAFSNAIESLKTEAGHGETALPEILQAALLKLAYLGIPDSVPSATSSLEALLAQASAIISIADQRLQELVALEGGFDPVHAGPEEQTEHQITRIKTILGADFQPLPCFTPGNGADLDATFAESLNLQGNDSLASLDWLQQMARVKEGVRRFDDVLLYAEAMAPNTNYQLTIGQLPRQAGDRWMALPLLAGQSLRGGRLSLVGYLPNGFQANTVQAGIMIDEWVETIPQAQSNAAVTFHYDRPNSRPPQTVLLAVPPDSRERWNVDALEKISLETLELCKLRTVNAEALARLDVPIWHFLPALYFTLNLSNDTVSTNFLRAATTDA